MVKNQNKIIQQMGDSIICLEYCITGLAELGRNPEVTEMINDYFAKKYKVLHIT